RTYFSAGNWERYRRAEELARKNGCTRQQVVLAWVLQQPLELYALIGPATVGEIEGSLGALDVSLAPEEVAWLNLRGGRERALAPGCPTPFGADRPARTTTCEAAIAQALGATAANPPRPGTVDGRALVR